MSRSVRKPTRSYEAKPEGVIVVPSFSRCNHESLPTSCMSRTFHSSYSTPTCPTSARSRSSDRILSAAGFFAAKMLMMIACKGNGDHADETDEGRTRGQQAAGQP